MLVAGLVLVVVCTLVPVALEAIVAHTAMLLAHSIVGSVGHTVVGCTAPHHSSVVVVAGVVVVAVVVFVFVVVVGPCFVLLSLLPRCALVHGNLLPCDPYVRICGMLLCLFLCLLAMKGSFAFCLSFDRCVS